MHKQLLVALSALPLFACNHGPAETDAASPASDDAWAETRLEVAVESGELEKVRSALGRFSPALNLRDTHSGDGALALAARTHGPMTVLILEHLGAEVELLVPRELLEQGAFINGTFGLGGRVFSLPGPVDRTQIEWPRTQHRVPVPARSATLSMAPDGGLRATDGQQMSAPILPEQAGVFADNWTQRVSPSTTHNAPEVATSAEPLSIELPAGGVVSAVEALGEKAPGMAVSLLPSPEATVADLTTFLAAALAEARVSSFSLGLSLGDSAVRFLPLSGEMPNEPMMTLKLDRRLQWGEIQPTLESLAPFVPLVLVQTLQDVSDPGILDLEGLPLGLPGGVLLPL